MKLKFKPFLFVLAVSLSLFSCSKEDDSTKSKEQIVANSSITTAGMLSGNIESYTSGVMDAVKMSNGQRILGVGTISSMGLISLNLQIPTSTDLEKWFKDGVPSGVTVSDETALFIDEVYLQACKNNVNLGSICHCNDKYYNSGADAEYTVGAVSTFFTYSDKTITIQGTHIAGSASIVYDMSLKKGWNEITKRITAFSKIGTIESRTITYTTTIPTDLKWRYFPGDF